MQHLVTGATGFFGKRLVKSLLARRVSVMHFLLRPGSEGKLDALYDYRGAGRTRAVPVGGEILDTVLTRINRKARIVICGAISQYNNTTALQGPKNYLSLLVNRARMEGMVVFDYAARYGEAIAEMAAYLKDGRMKSKEDVARGGVAAFPATLNRLFSGENFGKLVLEVAPGALG